MKSKQLCVMPLLYVTAAEKISDKGYVLSPQDVNAPPGDRIEDGGGLPEEL